MTTSNDVKKAPNIIVDPKTTNETDDISKNLFKIKDLERT